MGVSRFALDLCPPPADADEQETPVAEEYRRLSLKGVADELKNPPDDKKQKCVEPQPMEEDAEREPSNRKQDDGDAQGVASPIYGMLMAGGVVRDPLLAGAIA